MSKNKKQNQGGQQDQSEEVVETQAEEVTTEEVVTEEVVAEEVSTPSEEQSPVAEAVVEEAPVVAEVVTPAQVNIQAPESDVSTAPTEAGQEAKKAFDKALETSFPAANRTLSNLVGTLNAYADRMAPGRMMDDKAGAQAQLSFARTIMGVINSPTEFNVLYPELLNFFLTNKDGVVSERYVYRFHQDMVTSLEETKKFQAAINLLTLTCNPATRAAGMKQVDMSRVINTLANPNATRNLVAFYNV